MLFAQVKVSSAFMH